MNASTEQRGAARLSHLWWWLFGAFAALPFLGFVALGNWQLERRVWKLDLIERVEARVHAPAQAAPAPAEWFAIQRDSHEYLHVSLTGQFLPDNDTLVVAATELGSGYWVLTPLRSEQSGTVLVNRGFVGQGVEPAPVPEGEVTVSGLLRITEPFGSALRDNDPQAGRWYSRDVAAIADKLKLSLAPYFVDAATDQPGSPGSAGPVGGLTVISFKNTHMVYALTWYGLAAMVVGACVIVLRERRRRD